MKATEFWTGFKAICKDKELLSTWNNTKKFTQRMLDLLEGVIDEEDCVLEREYFRIDLISYRNTKMQERLGYLKNYSWELLSAIEHENDSRLWIDEVIKLAHISAELRVVIGYMPLSEKENQQSYVKSVSAVLNQISAWSQTKKNDFLLIIGDSHVKSASERCNYTAYIYDNESSEFILFEQ